MSTSRPSAQGSSSTQRYGISVMDVLDIDGKSEDELEELRYWMDGRIVLFGDISEVSHDYFETPVGRLYGIEYIAATIATLLSDGLLQPAGFGLELMLALLVLGGLIGSSVLQQPGARMAAELGLLVVWAGIVTWLYVSGGIIASMSYMLLAGFLSLPCDERSLLPRRAWSEDAHPRCLRSVSVAQGREHPDQGSDQTLPRRRRARDDRVFLGRREFSTISEQLTPKELVALLNDYLTAMCDIIADYDGTVDKFEGDAIIAFWGAPLSQPDHARLACFASIDMQNYMVGYRERLAAEGRPLLNVRMGLNTGRMLVGNLGSAQRMDYTMMGDPVNLAARLEGANKFYQTYSMISDFTYLQVADEVEARELDLIRVVGKREAVRVHELLDRRGRLDAERLELLVRYNQGLDFYKARKFKEAIGAFRGALEVVPLDGPSLTYIDRCEDYLAEPPPDDWDGVYTLTSKG